MCGLRRYDWAGSRYNHQENEDIFGDADDSTRRDERTQ